jgi:hypothetical protein
MAERLYDYSKLTDEQRQHLETLESEIEQAQKELLEQTPEHLLELGNVLRRSIETDDPDELRSYLQEHKIELAGGKRELEWFRDLLITQRIDTKDLEPEARARLRNQTLSSENPMSMSSDYRAVASTGQLPCCRDCRWFVTPPNDGEENADKSCVELGTKGADQACHGFTRPTN